MICPACNTEFPHGTVFCNRCHVTLVADLVEADEIVEKARSATSVTWQRLQNTVPCGNSVLHAGQIMTPGSLLHQENARCNYSGGAPSTISRTISRARPSFAAETKIRVFCPRFSR